MSKLYIIFFIIFTFHWDISIGQSYSWRHYSIADGLPQTQITALFQDSKNNIWIGTKGGVSRFDGLNFKTFSSNDGLSFDFVEGISEDHLGNILVSTRNGLNFINEDSISSIPYFYNKICFSAVFDVVRRAYFVATDSAIFQLNHKLKVKKKLPIPDSKLFQNPLKDEIIIQTSKGHHLNMQLDTLVYHPFSYLARMNRFGEITFSSNSAIYIFRKGRIQEIKEIPNLKEDEAIYLKEFDHIHNQMQNFHKNKKFVFFPSFQPSESMAIYPKKSFNQITCHLMDREGILWIGTENGVFKLLSTGFINYFEEQQKNIWSVLQDRKGAYWFGSFNGGMHQFYNNSWTSDSIDNNYYSGSIVTKSGQLIFNAGMGVYTIEKDKPKLIKALPIHTYLFAFEDATNKRILFTHAERGLVIFDQVKKVVIDTTYHHQRKHTGLMTSTLVDKLGRIWVSGKKGIAILENDQWYDLPTQKDPINIGAIAMLKDILGNIWLGSNDGLYFYDYNKLTKIKGNNINKQVGILALTNENHLLAGTINKLILLDLKKWYQSGETIISYFNQNNGFNAEECRHNSAFKDKDGRIWLCAADRVIAVEPWNLLKKAPPPNIKIDGLSYLNGSLHWQKINELKPKINPNIKSLRIDYHNINHNAPEDVKFVTFLEGFDKNWHRPTKERSRTFTNLNHGDYIFHLKAIAQNGESYSEEITYPFIILPGLWQRNDFRIISIGIISLFILMTGYSISEYKKRVHNKKDARKKAIAQLQFRSIRNMLDPHFTFNAINSIASLVFKENKEDVYDYFTKFSQLLRSSLRAAESHVVSIEDEIARVENYLSLEKLRFKDRLDFNIIINEEINMHWMIPRMCIQIYVENAVKHGIAPLPEVGGKLTIKLFTRDHQIIIEVMDNGVGRFEPKQQGFENQGNGKGMKTMEEYYSLFNQFNQNKISFEIEDLKDSLKNSLGTKITLSIPFDFNFENQKTHENKNITSR